MTPPRRLLPLQRVLLGCLLIVTLWGREQAQAQQRIQAQVPSSMTSTASSTAGGEAAKSMQLDCITDILVGQVYGIDGTVTNTGTVPIDDVSISWSATAPQLDQLEGQLTLEQGAIDASDANNSVTFNIGTLQPSQTVGYHVEWEAMEEGTATLTKVFQGAEEQCSFQVHELGSILVEKYEDLNANGTRDGGEGLLGGWEITLSGTTVIGTEVDLNGTTGSASGVQFSQIPPGDYSVAETIQNGWTQSDPGGGQPISLTLTSDQDTELAFGNYREGSIAGSKWNDLDGNGQREASEPGLSGWTIQLDGVDATTTDDDGNYLISSLPPGTYEVSELQQDGWTQTFPPGGSYTVTVQSGQIVEGVEFGNTQPQVGLSGTKFEDLNANGQRDAGEPGLEGWTIELDDGSSTTTDAQGNYAFTNLEPGTYTVSEVQQQGWTQTFPPGGTHTVTLQSGEFREGLDFGNEPPDIPPGSIHGQKFYDFNGSGEREVDADPSDGTEPPDSLEIGLDGFVIELYDSDGDLVDTQETMSMDLDGDGAVDPWTEKGLFWFEGLLPDTYTVVERSPASTFGDGTPWVQTAPPEGSYTIMLEPDDRVEGLLFGNAVLEGALDWGDLPDPLRVGPVNPFCVFIQCFPTTRPFGARHVIAGPWLGTQRPDAEGGGQPTPFSLGDDLTGDDEDGLLDGRFFSTGSGLMGEITFRVNVGQSATVSAWMDFDGDGILYAPAGELLFLKTYTTSGEKTEQFPVPSAHARGGYLRMRISTMKNAVAYPDGVAPDGEVEDYFGFGGPSGGADFGDAPDSTIQRPAAFPGGYRTRLIDGGAAHLFTTDTRIGETLTDGEDGDPGNTSLYANGDDLHVRDDENGIRFETGWSLLARAMDPDNPDHTFNVYGLTRGETASVRPLATKSGYVSVWIDWNRDGDWKDPGEHVLDAEEVESGPDYTQLTFRAPDGADLGWTYARFRYSQVDDQMPANGLVLTGEVEDYLIGVKEPVLLDYGDAPEPYPTRNMDGGPRHVDLDEGTLMLGTDLDFEDDGQPEPQALGDDDGDADGDDEEGVTFTTALNAGEEAELEVVVTADAGRSGFLTAWVDFNQDGDWADDGEHIIDDVSLGDGTHVLSYDVPASARMGDTYARFRFSETEGLGPTHDPDIETALDLPRGEVEDHLAAIAEGVATDDPEGDGDPEAFRLHPNYPNPFNPVTTIRYDVPEVSHVTLVVYDALGRQVQTLVDGQRVPGQHEAVFEATGLPSGVYVVRAQVGPNQASRVMLLLK